MLAERWKWTKVGRPGGYSHINLEECSALVWSVHDRLRRPGEQGTKCLHIIDSAVVTGAAKKGRSSSRQLNARMRQLGAVVIAGRLEPFYAWTASGLNPSDEPSSWFGIRATGVDGWKAAFRPPAAPRVAFGTQLFVSNAAGLDFATVLEDKFRAFLTAEGSFADIRRPANVDVFIHLCAGPRVDGDIGSQLLEQSSSYGRGLVYIAIDLIVHRDEH